MSKYIIPTPNQPCKVGLHKNKKQKLLLVTLSIIFCTSIILYILFNTINLFFSQQNILTPSKNYYLVCSSFAEPDITLAQQEAKNIKMRGGAGNIIPIQDTNLIVLHGYLDIQKAQEITKNMPQQNITAQVYTLKVNQHNINNYSTIEQQNILSNIYFVFDLLSTLYDIISQFDTLNITENKLYTHIHKLKISCDLELSSLTTIINFETNPIYLQMLEITSIIQSLCNRDFNGYNITTISSEFKYSFVQILLTICSTPTENQY